MTRSADSVLLHAPTEEDVCAVYQTTDQFLPLVRDFLGEGLQRGLQCFSLLDDLAHERLLQALQSIDADVNQAVREGQLQAISKGDYAPDDGPSAAGIYGQLVALVQRSQHSRFKGLRLAVDMTWTLAPGIRPADVLAWEQAARSVFATYPVSAIFCYNRHLLSPTLLRIGLRAHPLVSLDGAPVLVNPYYEPSVEVADEIDSAARLDWMLAQVRQLHETQTLLRRWNEENGVLAAISRVITASPDVADVYEVFAREVARLIRFDRLSIVTVDVETETVSTAFWTGMDVPSMLLHERPLAGSVIERVMTSRVGAIVQGADLAQPDIARSVREGLAAGLRSTMIVPLIIGDAFVGGLVFRSRIENAYTHEEITTAERIAAQIAGAIHNALQREALHRSQEENAALAAISRIATSSLDIAAIYERLAVELHRLLRFDRLSITLVDRQSETLQTAYSIGVAVPEDERPIPLTNPVLEQLLRSRAPLLLQGDEVIRRTPGLAPGATAGLVSTLVAPLVSRDRVIGTLTFRSKQPSAYGRRDVELAQRIAAQIAGIVHNAQDYADRLRTERQLAARVEQQAAIASLGLKAVQGLDLDGVLAQAVTDVARVLDVEYCEVLELSSDSADLLLSAGVGWQEGLVGHATVGTGLDSQAGYTLVSQSPVIVEDLQTESRFSGPALLRDHGVVSGITVVIHSGDRPYGVLGAHTRRQRRFDESEVDFLQSIANVLGMAIERERKDAVIRELSTPVLKVRKRVLLVPLVGTVTAARAQQLMDQLLEAVRMERALAVVIDLTGVAGVDGIVADYLVRTVTAARLLGAQTIVAGISGMASQALVQMGQDLTQIRTVGDLESGLEAAGRLVSSPRNDAPHPTTGLR